MMRNIYLYGRLEKQFGRCYRMNTATAGDVVRAIGSQIPEFIKELEKGSYHLIRGPRKSGLSLGLEDVNSFHLGDADLHIIPLIAGRKNGGGALKIILGVALIGAAIFLAPGVGLAGLATPIGGGMLGGLTYGNLAMLGIGLALAGAASMLSPQEKTKQKSSNSDASYTLSGPGNAYEQGNPVPLVYGETLTGSVMISGGVDIEQIGKYKSQ